MYRKSFPKCEVKGDLEPVEFGHMVSEGSVPKKCSTCSNLFEGECMRALDQMDSLLRLDYNSCDIVGATEPMVIEVQNENSIFVPKKCINCQFLSKSKIRDYFCSNEKEIWKDFPRDLDWGDWKPHYPLIGLRRNEEGKYSQHYLGPAIITEELVSLIMKNDNTKALKLYRKLNKVETIKEANEDIKILRDKLKITNHKLP